MAGKENSNSSDAAGHGAERVCTATFKKVFRRGLPWFPCAAASLLSQFLSPPFRFVAALSFPAARGDNSPSMNPPTALPPYPLPDDPALLRRMAQGDEQALGLLYDRWHSLVAGVVARILASREDVDDVVEEAFWQAWRQASRYEGGRGTVQTWLLTIARSRALDRARALKRRREEPLDGDATDATVRQVAAEGTPELDAEITEQRAIINAALAELPPEQREALELGYFGGLSQSEIAERTGQPLGTIKTRMRLAMQKLRGRLAILRDVAPGGVA